MPLFPKVQSPCPYRRNLAAVMDGNFCRMCQRQVVDLTAMSDDGRKAFMAGCKEEVCVSYRVPMRVAATALAAAGMLPAAAIAQEVPASGAAEIVEADLPEADYGMIIVGGITDPADVEFTDDPADQALPELPIVYEDEPQGRDVAQKPVSRPAA